MENKDRVAGYGGRSMEREKKCSQEGQERDTKRRKRMYGKQKPPLSEQEEPAATVRKKNNPLTEVQVQIVNQVRSKPAYISMVRENIEWTEEEKKIWKG